MKAYLDMLRYVLEHGYPQEDRTGTGTLAVFGYQNRYDLSQGFPLLTTKELHIRSIIYELLWFLSGDTNVKFLQAHGVTIWDEWADEDGNLGPNYGKQWCNWTGRDEKEEYNQIEMVLQSLREQPHSRRHIVSAWNVAELDSMALAPCHLLFQFHVAGDRLSCQLYQRSADLFLGVPFNVASYALLTSMVAQVCGLKPGEFIHTFGDLHLYNNHLEQAREQLQRQPYALPTLHLNPDITDLFDFGYEDIEFRNYQHHPHIAAPVAV